MDVALRSEHRAGRWRMILVAGAALAMGLAGCTQTRQEQPRHRPMYGSLPRVAPRPEPTPVPEEKGPEEIVLGKSVQGRPITAQVFGEGSETILFIATIHGNETAGTPLVRRLADHIGDHPEILKGRRIIIVPVANPDGMAANRRHNVRGVDLNRNFPASNYTLTSAHGHGALSEPESKALHTLLEKYPPKRIVSLHQPLSCVDFDGPGEALAYAMAGTCRLPVKKLGSRPGSLGSYAGLTKRIPIITVEFPRSADDLSTEALWQRYGKMLLVAVYYPSPVPEAGSPPGLTRKPSASPAVSVSPQ